MHLNKYIMGLLVISMTLVGCVHRNGSQTSDATPLMVNPQEARVIQETAPPSSDLNSSAELSAIPIEVNRAVLKWIDYFQGPGRPHMERYLSRLPHYAPIMKEVLKREGLPEDLIYIALIESGFSSTAHSSASAVGYWQFIKGTAKRYKLRVDSYVDERRDFVRSTEAAASYYKGLYNLFGSWYLAIASYNVGENRVKNIVMKYKTRDFWQLARENKLPSETVNYVPKFLAARLIGRDPEKFGFTDIEKMPPMEFKEVKFETSIDLQKLAKAMDVDYDDLRDLNPSYKRGVAFKDANNSLILRMPPELAEKATQYAAQAEAGARKSYATEEDWGYYRVRKGETLSSIARKFGTSTRVLSQLNRLSARSLIVAGRRIRVPSENASEVGKDSKIDAANEIVVKKKSAAHRRELKHQRKVASRKTSRIHVVKRGETLTHIARKHDITVSRLARINQMNRRSQIQAGTRLIISE